MGPSRPSPHPPLGPARWLPPFPSLAPFSFPFVQRGFAESETRCSRQIDAASRAQRFETDDDAMSCDKLAKSERPLDGHGRSAYAPRDDTLDKFVSFRPPRLLALARHFLLP